MPESTGADICKRIGEVRTELTGPRGRATFAQMLGIPSSTYQNYEVSRVPPAPVLVRIADVAGVDLRWLLTGRSEGQTKIPAGHPVLQRAANMLARCGDAAKPLEAFLDILEASLSLPAKAAAQTAGPQRQSRPAEAPQGPGEAARGWIPVLGRTAAGVPHFWSADADAQGTKMLQELIERHARRADRSSAPASAAIEQQARDCAVQIITLPAPAEGEAAEFIAASSIKARHGDAFALRIDGDSMSPEIRHGDLVVLSPSAPAADGKCAVVQLARQIGVTCKLYRREGQNAHLIPVNEAYSPQTHPAGKVVWALRVLARVRPQPV